MTLLLIILLLTATLILIKKYGYSNLFSIINQNQITFIALLVWIVFGFFTQLDYNQDWGCIGGSGYIFSSSNLFYSGIALALVNIGFFAQNKYLKVTILAMELLFWLYKLFLIKGGYAVGIVGVPSSNVVLFDMIALTLRILLIKQLLKLPINALFVSIVSFIIMAIKIKFFC